MDRAVEGAWVAHSRRQVAVAFHKSVASVEAVLLVVVVDLVAAVAAGPVGDEEEGVEEEAEQLLVEVQPFLVEVERLAATAVAARLPPDFPFSAESLAPNYYSLHPAERVIHFHW